jgi:hypothetical protein
VADVPEAKPFTQKQGRYLAFISYDTKMHGRPPVEAHVAGLSEVILPERNRHDLDDVPAEIRDTMRFHIVSSVDQVLGLALEAHGALASAA